MFKSSILIISVLTFCNLVKAEVKDLTVTLNDIVLKVEYTSANEVQQIEEFNNVEEVAETGCYSGPYSTRSKSQHFKKRFSRHTYLYRFANGDVYGIRDNGRSEKEYGKDWPSLDEFSQKMLVCGVAR